MGGNDKGMVDVVFNTDESAVPPAYLHVHLDEKMIFRLVSHKGSDKVLEYVGPDGKTYTYYLKNGSRLGNPVESSTLQINKKTNKKTYIDE